MNEIERALEYMTILGDKVILKQDPADEATKSGIVLPKAMEKQHFLGTVLAVGIGRCYVRDNKIVRQEMEVKKGDRVMYPRYTAIGVAGLEQSTLILKQSDILLVVEGGKDMPKVLMPIGDRIVVRPYVEETKTTSGIILPDSTKEKPQEGIVVAVGRGRIENGTAVPMEVTEGDKVVYSKYGGTEIKIDEDELVILTERDVLAIKGG